MKILITEVVKEKDKIFAHFRSSLGNGFGEWKSRMKPKKLGSYYVELNVGDKLVWKKNVELVEAKVMSIKYENDIVAIQGFVESIESSGKLCFMRLDVDLLMFSCPGIPVHIRDYIKISTRKIELFDINL